MTSDSYLVNDALAIWRAGVAAVTPERLFRNKLAWDAPLLSLEHITIDFSQFGRITVVGAGKASAAMAVALHRTVLSKLSELAHPPEIRGWINAPAETFTAKDQLELGNIYLHTARPAGANQPTAAAVLGTEKILKLVRDCDTRDLVLCLLSGGGSAVLVAPKAGITLQDKQAVAREIAAAGGDIEQLNTIRRALSDVKGGGLARACQAGQLITLIISDVLGDPLETIASGPTLLSASCDPGRALNELDTLGLSNKASLANVIRYLQCSPLDQATFETHCPVEHIILGNNADAVDAAGVKAVELGYRYIMQSARAPESDVRQLTHTVARSIKQLITQPDIDCWISGGEPTVKLPADAGRGGRNQQLALGTLIELLNDEVGTASLANQRPVVFVSGGTDGEDGPTDAAGAWFDRLTVERLQTAGLEPQTFLERADAYSFFEKVGGLLHTGPTGTNVCDLRIALAGPSSTQSIKLPL